MDTETLNAITEKIDSDLMFYDGEEDYGEEPTE
jgi:hypothetical protein